MFALFAYEGEVRKIIRHMKFSDVSSFCDCFGEEMVAVAAPYVKSPTIVPIPLSPDRLRYRGYNQCLLLAKSLSKHSGWPVANLLKGDRMEFSQVDVKSKSERKKNVKGVFKIRDGEIPEEVILLDDVITTGATVEEACRVLKRAGVKKVVALALAMGR